MITLTKQEVRFITNVLDINAKDLRKEAETLHDYEAWQKACIGMAENYERLISDLNSALERKDKRIAIKY